MPDQTDEAVVEGAVGEVVERTITVRAVLDSVGGVLIFTGMACGDVAAWMAGGRVPGLATLGGALITAGAFLAYR